MENLVRVLIHHDRKQSVFQRVVAEDVGERGGDDRPDPPRGQRPGRVLARGTSPEVVAGEQDPFYTPALFRETAAGIPNAKLCLYPNMGHPAVGKQFERDVLAFLREDT